MVYFILVQRYNNWESCFNFFSFKSMMFSSRHRLEIMSSVKYRVLNNNNRYMHIRIDIYKACKH